MGFPSLLFKPDRKDGIVFSISYASVQILFDMRVDSFNNLIIYSYQDRLR